MPLPTKPAANATWTAWGDAVHALVTTLESGLSDLTDAVANRLRFDQAQTLTAAQKTQVKTNLGVGITIYAARTAADGVPTAAQCAAAGYPDGAFFTVDPA